MFTEELIETFIAYKRKNEGGCGSPAPAPLRIRAVLRHLSWSSSIENSGRGREISPAFLFVQMRMKFDCAVCSFRSTRRRRPSGFDASDMSGGAIRPLDMIELVDSQS